MLAQLESRGARALPTVLLTPLHSAVSSGHECGCVSPENGADTGATTKQGRTVLHYLKGSKPVAEIVCQNSRILNERAGRNGPLLGCIMMQFVGSWMLQSPESSTEGAQ